MEVYKSYFEVVKGYLWLVNFFSILHKSHSVFSKIPLCICVFVQFFAVFPLRKSYFLFMKSLKFC